MDLINMLLINNLKKVYKTINYIKVYKWTK